MPGDTHGLEPTTHMHGEMYTGMPDVFTPLKLLQGKVSRTYIFKLYHRPRLAARAAGAVCLQRMIAI